jgi:hypothetical protein
LTVFASIGPEETAILMNCEEQLIAEGRIRGPFELTRNMAVLQWAALAVAG